MKIVYFGTAEFAVPALRAVAEHVVLVVSQPDRPSGRGLKLQPSPVRSAALELGLTTATPERSKDPEFIEQVKSLEPDFLLVAAYGQILRPALLEAGKRGAINLHGSILPRYRGAAPIQRAIQNGDRETGVTLMQMDRGMDSGDVITYERMAIGPDDTYGEVQSRLAEVAADLARDWAPILASGVYGRNPQDHDFATHAPKVEKLEAELRFERPAQLEYNRFRAFTPSPGAWVETAFGQVRLGSVRLGDSSGEPGTIVGLQPELEVAFQAGSLRLLEVQPAGKKRMSGRDWANGLRLKPGTMLR